MFQARWSTRRSERVVSSSMPEPTNQAAVLARKAEADAIAVRELAGNPEISSWVRRDFPVHFKVRFDVS
jgi:hypothetical protein